MVLVKFLRLMLVGIKPKIKERAIPNDTIKAGSFGTNQSRPNVNNNLLHISV